MKKEITVSSDYVEIINMKEYNTDIGKYFKNMPDVAWPIVRGAKKTFAKIERMLYETPAFIDMVKASVPKEALQAVLTNEQKAKLADGTVKLMTKKDGSLMASLVNTKTNKIVSNISLEQVKLSPEIMQTMTSYATQMQLAQIAEQIQMVQIAIEEVRQGQEFDRLATAYSCQQKILQAVAIKNPELRAAALLRIANDAEDSKNLLMLSQKANVEYVKNQPEDFWHKLIAGNFQGKIDSRINEIRESLCAMNMVSLVEAIAYQELGEPEAARLSLQYYALFLQNTYFKPKKLVERLDMLDPSPKNYWSKTLPKIEKNIKALPCNKEPICIGGGADETTEMPEM